MGPLVPIAKYLDISQFVAEAFTGFIILIILANYKYKSITFIEDIDRKSYGTFFYCLSLFILIFVFWNKNYSALLAGVFVMTFGDGLAGLIGKRFKSFSWKIFNQKKSLLGTLVMFLTSFLILTFVGNNGEFTIDIKYFSIAFIATLLEQISIIGIDNLSVPIITSTIFYYLITI
tara:strand:- start:128 stop:652 length:525 start_codon:yes stop_codon:yes gene_type:complete